MAHPVGPWLVLVGGGPGMRWDELWAWWLFQVRGRSAPAVWRMKRRGAHLTKSSPLPPDRYTLMMNAYLTRPTGEGGKQLVPCWSTRLSPPRPKPGQSLSLSPLAPTDNETEKLERQSAEKDKRAGRENWEQWSVWPHNAIIISNNSSWAERARKGSNK